MTGKLPIYEFNKPRPIAGKHAGNIHPNLFRSDYYSDFADLVSYNWLVQSALNIFRSVIPPLGGIDISPILAILLLNLAGSLVGQLGGATVGSF